MTAAEAIKKVLDEDLEPGPMMHAATQLARALQVAIATIMKIKEQNRTRGYPSGMEWIKLDEQAENALAKIDKIFEVKNED